MRARAHVFVRLVPILCLALAACGSSGEEEEASSADESEATMRPEDTFAGDLIEKKEEIPQAIEDATRQHMDDTRRAIDDASGAKSDEPAQ